MAQDAASRGSAHWTRTLGWLLVLAAPALELWHIYRYAVNIPIWDEWALVPFLRTVHEGGDWWGRIFNQHNEHRVAALRVPLAIIAEWTRWNVVAQMVFGWFLQVIMLIGLWLIFAPRINRSPWRFAPVAFLVFALSGYSIFLYGFMFVWSLMLAAVVWCFWLLSRLDWRGFAGALVSGLVASFTLNNGLLVWPIGLLLLWRTQDRWPRLALWAATGAGVLTFYYWDYQHPGHHPSLLSALSRPVTATGFLLALLGGPFGAGRYGLSIAFGAALAGALLVNMARRLPHWRQWPRDEQVGAGLALFALISAAGVMASRIGIDLSFALEPRYTSFTMLIPIALYFHLAGGAASVRRPLGWSLAAVLALGFFATTVDSWNELRAWSGLRQHQLNQMFDADNLSDDQLAGHSPNVPRLRTYIRYMKDNRLGAFATMPVSPETPVAPTRPAALALRVERYLEGRPLLEILPGQDVVQKFACPVTTLNDLAVPFAIVGRREKDGRIIVTLSEGGVELGRADRPARSIEQNGWVRIRLAKALSGCYGRQLVVRVRSEGGVPGSGLTVWSFPAYYDGALLQTGAPDLIGWSLGLEINQ